MIFGKTVHFLFRWSRSAPHFGWRHTKFLSAQVAQILYGYPIIVSNTLDRNAAVEQSLPDTFDALSVHELFWGYIHILPKPVVQHTGTHVGEPCKFGNGRYGCRMPAYEHLEEVFPAQKRREEARIVAIVLGMSYDEEQFRYLRFKQFLFGDPVVQL